MCQNVTPTQKEERTSASYCMPYDANTVSFPHQLGICQPLEQAMQKKLQSYCQGRVEKPAGIMLQAC